MLAANWPVVVLRATYADAWTDISEAVVAAGAGPADLAEVTGGTASRWFALDSGGPAGRRDTRTDAGASSARGPSPAPGSWVAPGAVLVGDVHLGPEASIWYGCVLRADGGSITVGRAATSRTAASRTRTSAATSCWAEGVSSGIAPSCTAASSKTAAWWASEPSVLTGARIGKGSLVAAGAIVREGDVVRPVPRRRGAGPGAPSAHGQGGHACPWERRTTSTSSHSTAATAERRAPRRATNSRPRATTDPRRPRRTAPQTLQRDAAHRRSAASARRRRIADHRVTLFLQRLSTDPDTALQPEQLDVHVQAGERVAQHLLPLRPRRRRRDAASRRRRRHGCGPGTVNRHRASAVLISTVSGSGHAGPPSAGPRHITPPRSAARPSVGARHRRVSAARRSMSPFAHALGRHGGPLPAREEAPPRQDLRTADADPAPGRPGSPPGACGHPPPTPRGDAGPPRIRASDTPSSRASASTISRSPGWSRRDSRRPRAAGARRWQAAPGRTRVRRPRSRTRRFDLDLLAPLTPRSAEWEDYRHADPIGSDSVEGRPPS